MKIVDEELSFSDGQIVEYKRNENCLELIFRDWREISFTLTFTNIIDLHDSGSIGIDIEYLAIADSSDISTETNFYLVASLANKEPNTYKSFKFFDSWGSRCILAVVAKELSISKNL